MAKRKLNTKSLLVSLKKDYESAKTARDVQDIKVKRWRAEYNGEPYGNEENGKSKLVSRDIKKQDEWQHASIISPFVSTPDIINATPVTFEDLQAAEQNGLLLNTQFTRKFDRYNFISKSVKILSRDGTVIVQTGWEHKSEEVEVEVETVVVDPMTGEQHIEMVESTETNILVNKPTAVVCRYEDVFIDPTCQGDMDNAQFVIYRYETDISTLKQDGKYKNLDKIQVQSDGSESDEDFENTDESDFVFEDNPRKKLIVYEYWGNYDVNGDGVAEPIVCAWVNDTVIRLQGNPYPDKKPPFIVVPFNKVPFELYGEANAELISDNQKVKTAVIRGIINNMAQSNNGQKGIRKGALDANNRIKFFAGKNFEFNNSVNDFWDGSYNQIPGSAFEMLNKMDNDIESITGVKGFNGGISGNSIGSTATSARGAMDAINVRRMNIVRNISENLVKPLIRKWMSYNAEFLSDEEVVRITNDQFVQIKKDDLDGRIDIDIQVATAEDNAAKVQELSFMMQTLGQSMNDEMRNMLLAEIAKKQNIPEIAEKIESMETGPSEYEQQMQQIMLERERLTNKNLEADIYVKQARAAEDHSDREKRLEEARLLRAKTRNLDAVSDIKDIEFIRKEEGVDHKEKMEIKEQDRLRRLDEMILQSELGGPDEQIGVPN